MNDLRDELAAFAAQTEVTSGSAARVIAAGRRRTRRAAAARLGGIAAVVVAGGVGIQMLSGSSLDGEPIDPPSGVASANPVDGASSTLANPPTGSSGTEASVPESSGSADQAWPAGTPQARAAQSVASRYRWTAYRADSPEAAALRFDPNDRYALGTADGMQYPDQALWVNEGGQWQVVDGFVGSREADSVIVGDIAYAVSDDNAEAPTLGAFDITSRTWSDLELPADAFVAVPEGSTALDTQLRLALSQRDDTLIVMAVSRVFIDSVGVGQPESSWVRLAPGGTEVQVADRDCISKTEQAAAQARDGGTALESDPVAACAEAISVSELGLTAAEVAALQAPTETLWTLVGGEWQRSELPRGDLDGYGLLGNGVVVGLRQHDTSVRWRSAEGYFVVGRDGTLSPIFDGQSFGGVGGSPVTPPSGREVALGNGKYLMRHDLTSGQWSATDFGSLGAIADWGSYELDVIPQAIDDSGAVVAVANASTRLPTEETQLTSGEYTLTFPSGSEYGSSGTLVNNTTGETFRDFVLSTESGAVVAKRFTEGSDAAEVLAEFEVDWTTVPYLGIELHDALMVSTDGVGYAVIDDEQLATAAGIQLDEGPRLKLARAEIREGQLVVSAFAPDAVGDGDGDNYVLVGTPT